MTTPRSPTLKWVDAALEAWAKWAYQGSKQLGWPSVSILGRLATEGFTGAAHTAHIPDMPESVLATERALLRLSPVDRSVVVKHYVQWEPVEISARRCHLTSATFRTRLHRARSEVAAYLEGAACVVTRDRS